MVEPHVSLYLGPFNVRGAEKGMALELVAVASILEYAPKMLAIFQYIPESFIMLRA